MTTDTNEEYTKLHFTQFNKKILLTLTMYSLDVELLYFYFTYFLICLFFVIYLKAKCEVKQLMQDIVYLKMAAYG
jgi:hypothetical protein